MNTLTAFITSLVLTAAMCASYVSKQMPTTQFVEADSGIASAKDSPTVGPPVANVELGE